MNKGQVTRDKGQVRRLLPGFFDSACGFAQEDIPFTFELARPSSIFYFLPFISQRVVLRLLLLACFPFCSACVREHSASQHMEEGVAYASLLHSHQADSYVVATVLNPWKEGGELARYVMVPADSALPGTLPEGTLLRTPLRRAIAFSAVHAALLQKMGVADGLLGICDAQFVVGDSLKNAVEVGAFIDFGAATQPNMELIIAAHSDGLLVSPIENAGYGLVEKLNVPLIVCADYMETSGMGRAEWMRFFGLLFGCEEEADSLFREVERNYRELADLAARAEEHPRLLYDLKEGAAWYVPGGKSTWAEIFRDAATDYPFADNKASGSVALSFEDVLVRAGAADFWMLKYGRSAEMTYTSIAEDFPPYAKLRPWQQRRIFGCNTFSVPYYEDAPFRPDRLLHDVIKMAHPQLLSDEPFYYYSPLEEL